VAVLAPHARELAVQAAHVLALELHHAERPPRARARFDRVDDADEEGLDALERGPCATREERRVRGVEERERNGGKAVASR